MIKFNSLLFALLTSFMSVTTTAQESDSEKAPNVREIINEKIIIVTGSHQKTERLNLAGNVENISSQEIELVSAVHPSDLLNRATGVHIQTNNGMESLLSIRSPVLTGPGAAGAYLFLEDGISTRSAGFANNNGLSELNLAQAQEVEIIRGPASAFYGSNAVHGVVNVLTKTPSDNQKLSLVASPNQRYQLQGTFGSASGEHGLNGSFQAINDAGYRDHSDFNSFKVNGRHDYEKGDNRYSTRVSGFVLDQNTAGFISSGDNGSDCYTSSLADERLYKDRDAMEKNCDEDAYRKWSSFRFASSWHKALDGDNSFTLTPYFRINQMEFRQHYLPSEAIEENSHYSVGLTSNYHWRLEPNLSFVVGVDAELTQGELTQTQQLADRFSFGKARQQGIHYDYEVRAGNIAPYLQGDWQSTDAINFTASVRFDSTNYDYDNLVADGTTKADGTSCFNNDDEATPCLYLRPSDSDDQFDNSSTKFGLNYRINKSTALFSAWSFGFRAPQTTDLYRLQNQQAIGEIKSEEINSSEVGIRGVSERFQYELVVYTMTKNNFFFRDSNGLNVTDGETSHRGMELGLNYQLTNSFDLSLNYSYGEHLYEFDRSSSGVVNGNEVDTAPKHLANARIIWNASQDSQLELEWLHMGDYYLDPANEHSYDGHDLLQLRGSIQLNNSTRLFARIENLTNEKYATRADFAFGSYRYFGGQPLGLHLGFDMNF